MSNQLLYGLFPTKQARPSSPQVPDAFFGTYSAASRLQQRHGFGGAVGSGFWVVEEVVAEVFEVAEEVLKVVNVVLGRKEVFDVDPIITLLGILGTDRLLPLTTGDKPAAALFW